MNIGPEDLASLSAEEKRALLVKMMKERAKNSLSQAEAVPQISGNLNRLAVNVQDLASEAVLDPAIRFESPDIEQFSTPEHIFMTGATGFLGAFLLHELLEQTSAELYCLVRCTSPEEGQARIIRNLAAYYPRDGHPVARIRPVPGDLSRPLLGLSAQKFREMAAKVDSIYHGGAMVNWVYPYPRLMPANVQGTHEVLRLASLGKPKPLHYISTISVFPLFNDQGSHTIGEWDSLDHGGVLYSGYAQSKWVAEKLVAQAKNRGLPVGIYRPGLITGHSQTGAWNTDDVTCNLIKSWIELGYAPELEAATDMTPVDYVSEAIVHLSNSPQSLGRVYHLVNSQVVYAEELVAWMQSFGYPIETLPYERWRGKLIHLAQGFHHDSAQSVAPLFSIGLSENEPRAGIHQEGTLDSLGTMIVGQFADHSVRFDCQNAVSALANESITCPPIDAQLFGNYLSFFIRSGFIPAPPAENLS